MATGDSDKADAIDELAIAARVAVAQMGKQFGEIVESPALHGARSGGDVGAGGGRAVQGEGTGTIVGPIDPEDFEPLGQGLDLPFEIFGSEPPLPQRPGLGV